MKSIINLLFFVFLSSSLFAQQGLSGNYLISNQANANCDFTSFTSAIDSLVQVGVAGQVTFKIDSGTYTEQIVIPYINNTSATNTITFESLSGDSTDVVLKYNIQTNNAFVLKFDSTKYITFQNLTLEAVGTGVNGSGLVSGVIEIKSNSNNISIKNNVIIGGQKGLSHHINIKSNGCDIEISHNLIKNGSIGINSYNGTPPTYPPNYQDTLYVFENIISDFKYCGIGCENRYYTIIESNHIETTIDSIRNVGLFFHSYLCHVFKNKIINTVSGITSTQSWDINVYNNFISIDRPGWTAYGVEFWYQSDIDFVFNTVNIINGDTNSSCVCYSTNDSIYWASCYNNILIADSCMVYKNDLSHFLNCDYNVCHTNSAVFAQAGTSVNLTTYASLSSFKQAGYCLNCLDSLPALNSPTDLHLTTDQFSGIGSKNAISLISSITDDIDGQVRDTNNVRPGADEYYPFGEDLMIQSIILPEDTVVALSSDTIKVVVRNIGILAVSAYQIKIDISGESPSIYNINIALPPGNIDTLILDVFTVPKYNFTISATAINSQDVYHANDSIAKNIISKKYDVGIVKIISPSDTVTTNNSQVEALIKNFGDIDLTTFPISYNFYGNTVCDTFLGNLSSGDSIIFTFNQNINSIYLDSEICVTTYLALDVDSINDSYCKTYVFDSTNSISEIKQINSFVKIFPNPTSDIINFEIEKQYNNCKFELKIFDSFGKKIKNTLIKDYTENSNSLIIIVDVNTLKPGIYFYQINIVDHKQTKKEITFSSGKFTKL